MIQFQSSKHGFVSEWPMVHPWKGCVEQSTESSNLSETTININFNLFPLTLSLLSTLLSNIKL